MKPITVHTRRNWIRLVIAAPLLPAVTTAAVDLPLDFEDESSFRFEAADFVPTGQLTGPNYTIESVCSVQDGRLLFTLTTEWGQLTAHGRPMLELRIREMYAIERARQMNRDPQLITSFLGTLDETRKGAELILTDPIGSVFRVPQAVGATINDVVNAENRKSGGQTRRRVAAELDCDSETDNPLLSALLDWIAARQGVGSLAGRAGLSLVVPGLGLVPASAQFKEQLASRQPSEIVADVQQLLLAAGYDPSRTKLFGRSDQYTLLQKLQATNLLVSLSDVHQQNVLLQRLRNARSRSDRQVMLRELLLLQQLHVAGTIETVIDGNYLTAVRHDHSLHLVCADDFIVLSRSTAEFLQAHVATFDGRSTQLVGDVVLSSQARGAFAAANIRPYQVL